MTGCACEENGAFEGMSDSYKHALWAVIAINAGMFAVEMSAGALAGSRALQADALDFLGDTLTYGMTLLVIGRPLRLRASAALAKGISLAVLGLWIFGSTAYDFFAMATPRAEIMSGIGAAALLANVASVLLLLRFRDGDANIRSVWLCSRNDAIGNGAVILAGGAVWLTHSALPDLIVAAAMASLFLWSAYQIIRQASGELRSAAPVCAPEGVGIPIKDQTKP